MSETTFRVDDLCCPTEEQIIRNRLKGMDGVSAVECDVLNRRVRVTHELPDPAAIRDAMSSVGMKAVIADDGADDDHGPAGTSLAQRVMMGASGALAFAAEAVGWSTGHEQSWPVIALALGSIALGGKDTIRKGIAAVRTFTLNINFLMSVAIIGAMVIGSWPEAAMVTFLFGLAEMIEAASMDRARNAIRSLMELAPETAMVRTPEGGWAEVPASQVGVGQTVRVRPGERIALDGRVVAGSSTVNQAPVTGESISVSKGVGDDLFAGTINDRGSLDFEVTAAGPDTTLARIIRAVQQAQSERAPTQRFIDQFARVYTPLVVVVAILVAAVPPLGFGQPFQPWLYKALVLLVIACPCALVISTPVTVVSALASAARRGMLVKGGTYVEEGRKISVVALDKTGTLTHGKPKVTDVVPLADVPEAEVLAIAAALDALSEHPVATAIVAAHPGRPEDVEEFESVTGRGVRGRVRGVAYVLGNHRLADEEGLGSAELSGALDKLESQGKTAVVLGDGKRALGVIAVADTVRDSSIEAVRRLHEMGVKTLMLSGDNERTAQAIASQVGIDTARGGLLPEDKLAVIEGMVAKGEWVGMVGDGINDAPALARAHVGFAMGAAGTDTAIETADVALMKDDLRKVPEFVALSRKASAVLKQNIAFAIGIKAVFFALAFAGVATLWMAVFADVGASLLVVGNGLRLLRKTASGGQHDVEE